MSTSGGVGSIAGEAICDRLKVPDIIKARANDIAMNAVDLIPSKGKKACMVAAIYIACEEAYLPIGLKDICPIADGYGLSTRDIVAAKVAIKKECGSLLPLSDDVSKAPFAEPLYLERFCSTLKLGTKELEAATEIYLNLNKLELGHTARLKAAAVAYLTQRIFTDKKTHATKLNLFKEIADMAKLSPRTIREFYKGKVIQRISKIDAELD